MAVGHVWDPNLMTCSIDIVSRISCFRFRSISTRAAEASTSAPTEIFAGVSPRTSPRSSPISRTEDDRRRRHRARGGAAVVQVFEVRL